MKLNNVKDEKSTLEVKAIQKADDFLQDSGILDWLMVSHGGLYIKIYFEFRETAILMFKNQFLEEEAREEYSKLRNRRNALAASIGSKKAYLKPWEIRSRWILYEHEISYQLEKSEYINLDIVNEDKKTEEINNEKILKIKKKNPNFQERSYSFNYKTNNIKYKIYFLLLTLLGASLLIFEYALKAGLSFIPFLALIRISSNVSILSNDWKIIISVFSGIALIQYISWYAYNDFFYANEKEDKCRKCFRILILFLIYLSETFLGYEGLSSLKTPQLGGYRPDEKFSMFLAAGSFVLINILFSVSKARKNKDIELKQSKILGAIESYKMVLLSIVETLGLIDLYEKRFKECKDDFEELLYREAGIYDLANLVSLDVYQKSENNKKIEIDKLSEDKEIPTHQNLNV